MIDLPPFLPERAKATANDRAATRPAEPNPNAGCRFSSIGLSILGVGVALGIAAMGFACGIESPLSKESSRHTDPRSVLERAAAALQNTGAVRYDFEYGAPDDPTGWVTGTTWMKQVTDLDDSWIRVEGVIHDQPRFNVAGRTFAYGTDGERAWARENDAELTTAPVGEGSNRLAAVAVYGYLPEWVEAAPLWRELDIATGYELLEPETVAGHPCDVVRVAIPLEGGGTTEIIWSVSREDHLPRRGRWLADFAGPKGMTFTMAALETGVELSPDDFTPPDEAEETLKLAIGVGDPVPEWRLPTPDGSEVALDDLAGNVAVLDFWNTWCPICRSIGPATRELAREFDGGPVRFFGVNLLETGDAVGYWNEIGSPYPLLLDGEELAVAIDLPWQPGIAVIGPEGDLLYKQLGASEDRIRRVRAAIREGLRRIETKL